jgi:hypothetical protein
VARGIRGGPTQRSSAAEHVLARRAGEQKGGVCGLGRGVRPGLAERKRGARAGLSRPHSVRSADIDLGPSRTRPEERDDGRGPLVSERDGKEGSERGSTTGWPS